MEYTAELTGSRFSDRPRCTHPALAELARGVSDPARTGPEVAGVAAAVAAHAVGAAAESGHGSRVTAWQRRRVRLLGEGDRPGRGRAGRHRDSWCAVDLVRGAFAVLDAASGEGAARDRVLIGLLDRALDEADPARRASPGPQGPEPAALADDPPRRPDLDPGHNSSGAGGAQTESGAGSWAGSWSSGPAPTVSASAGGRPGRRVHLEA